MQLYWILLPPFVAFLICLEFFKMPQGEIAAGRILKRVVVSMLLLFSFEQCMNTIAMLADGITEKIGGVAQLKELTHLLWEELKSREVSWLRVREHMLYMISLISYAVAYLGVFVADVLTHFVWSILYVVSPLMILMYVSERTAFVTMNLYKGMINVLTWKIFWSILGVLLLKVATSHQIVDGNTDDYLQAIFMNLCIGLSMLFVPVATKSLLTSGMEGAASALATAPAAAAFGTVKLLGKKAIREPMSGFKGTRKIFTRGVDPTKRGVQGGRTVAGGSGRASEGLHDRSGNSNKRMPDRILRGDQ